MNVLALTEFRDAVGEVIAPAGRVVTREAFPSTDAALAPWFEQGALVWTDNPVDYPEPEPEDSP